MNFSRGNVTKFYKVTKFLCDNDNVDVLSNCINAMLDISLFQKKSSPVQYIPSKTGRRQGNIGHIQT